MASIRKRTWESGGEQKAAWIVDYFDQGGERHIKTFAKKKEADAYLTDVLHEVREGTHTAPSGSITVREAAEAWLKAVERRGRERSTLKQYQNHVTHHINPLLGNVKLAELTTPRLERFADDLRDRPYADDPAGKLSPAMAKKVLGSVKGIIKEAQRTGKIAKNPAAPVTIRVPKRGRMKIRAGRDFPSKLEINALLSAVAGRWRPLIITAVFTGMRSSELRGLRWADIDFDAEEVHVHQRADAWGEMGPPKSEAGERTISMVPMVISALKEWKLQCPKRDRGKKGKDDPGVLDLVFPNGEGNPESHANICNRGFYPLQIAGAVTIDTGEKDEQGEPILGAKYGFHTLRHFFASWLIDAGHQIKEVQVMLGHSTLAMTADTYGHLFPDEDGNRAKRMAAAQIALVR
jgi:integrase